jgi:hypothetical protein
MGDIGRLEFHFDSDEFVTVLGLEGIGDWKVSENRL